VAKKDDTPPNTPLNTPIATDCGIYYLLKADHRTGGNQHKSQWTISRTAEIGVFDASVTAGWRDGASAWGLHLVAGSPTALGTSTRSEELRIAKFVGPRNVPIGNPAERNPGSAWHGYPADYRQNAHDRPTMAVLTQWLVVGHLAKHEIRRIRGGQPCSLSA
jgi:hypothetical protein